MKMERRPGMFTNLTSIIVWAVLLGQGSSQKTGGGEDVLKELFSRWSKGQSWTPPDPNEQPLLPWVRNLVGSFRTLGLIPGKNLASLNQQIDRRRLSSFLYNISLYLQEMGAELQEAPAESGEEQLWEKVLHFFLQSEGNQWNRPVPPRPSMQVQDWFLSLRGSRHWDWFLGVLQSLVTLLQRQPHRPLLTFLTHNWRTLSAVLDAALQAVVSGTYGQASAGLQGFICALKGRGDCAFNVSWLQQLLRFLETRSWKPVVSLHPAGGTDDSFGRLRPFSLPPEAQRQEGRSMNVSADDDPDSVQSFVLQALSRSGGGERGGHMAQSNLALVQSLDGLRRGIMHQVGTSVYRNLRSKVSRVTMAMLDDVSSLVDVPQPNAQGQCSAGDLRQLILWGIRHNLMWNTQALGVSTQSLPDSLPFLSCPSADSDGRSTSNTSTSQTIVKRRHRSDMPGSGRLPAAGDSDPTDAHPMSTEILEAACNDSIPGLTGVSNFTVFLYCKLFEGQNGSVDVGADTGLDLHATCSDAAWYLSAAEDDFLWVHVCGEFFAQEFNNTVCANSSFWLQRAHQAAGTDNRRLFNRTSLDELCVHLSPETTGSASPDESCLSQLGRSSLTAQAFRRCFLPNSSALISGLCGGESLDSRQPVPESSWAAAFCFKLHNFSQVNSIQETCRFREWAEHGFVNSSLLELCEQTHGLREYICLNASLYHRLRTFLPQSDFCADLQAEQDNNKCFLQRFFDLLPAPYEFDTSQLCVDPVPLLSDVLHKLSVCEVEVGQHHMFLVALGYVLRVLDVMVGLSSGLEEGEREARQGLGQAILLSSLLDNASWVTLQPEASVSVLQTVGVFLRREQNTTVKEDLLSCFSPVLWDLIQRDNNSSALRVLLQEYLQMPTDSIRTLVMSAEKDAVKRFLSHVHRSWDQLHVETSQASQRELQAMETMTAAFIHKFPRVTPELFVDLSQFIPFMSVSDIKSFPASLMVNDSVLTAIRDHSSGMRSLQKKAFVQRLLQSSVVGDVPSWPPYFLRSILPLLPFLPVRHFEQLTSQQLVPLVELLGNSSLDAVRGRHVLRTLFTETNLTIDRVLRLGVLACYLDPLELQRLLQDSDLSSALWQQLLQCVSQGFVRAGGRLSSWLTPAARMLNASGLSPPELLTLREVLPELGASFVLSLPSLQLVDVLSQPGLRPYSPAQAYKILSKISKDTNFSMETLCRLKPLHAGLSSAVLGDLHWPETVDHVQCECWRTLLSELRPGHRVLLYDWMLQALHSQDSAQQLRCLVPFVPLKKLMETLGGDTFLRDLSLYRDMTWSPQQAQVVFKRISELKNITSRMTRDLGHIASGMTCDVLKLWSNDTDSSELLRFVTELPGDMRPALRKCLVEELRRRPGRDLGALSLRFSATLPVTLMEELSNTSFRAVLDHIHTHFTHFLRLPRHKQTNLAEKAATELGSSQAGGGIDGTTLDLLGPLLPFLDRDNLAAVDRGALAERLEEMRSFCLPQEALGDISRLLTHKNMFGDTSQWKVGDVEHLGRLMFSLSVKQMTSIPLTVLNKDTVEGVLDGQRIWEDSVVGGACMSLCMDRLQLRQRTHSLIRGIVKPQSRWTKVPVPTCADVRGTFPSAWTSSQLSRMSRTDVERCVEVFGQDASLSSEQRRALWMKLRQFLRPVSELSSDQVLALGSVVTEFGDKELYDTSFSDLGLMAHVGELINWSPKKMRAVLQGTMRRRRLKVQQLTAVDLVTFGHVICGLHPSEISRLNPHELSMSALFLRELSLPCTEQQMEALTGVLSRPEAFGPISSWGPEVFTEIGTLAVGLEDMVLSALTPQQMEGITSEALALMPPKKMAVALSSAQLSRLSVEQAWAVTEDQWTEMDAEQRHAVSLSRYEGDVFLELRGRNSAALRTHTPTRCLLALCLLLWQLI